MLPRRAICFLTSSIVAIAITCYAKQILADDPLFSVQRSTELKLTESNPQNKSNNLHELRGGTLVRDKSNSPFSSPVTGMTLIETLENHPRIGWVQSDDLVRIDHWVALLNHKAKSIVKSKTSATVPQIIRAQNDPQIRQAWQETANAFEANNTRPENERLPEPYFARAEIWMAVNNYPLAIEDYVNGLHYARLSGRDIITYSPYFSKMQLATEKLLSLPVPPTGTTKNIVLRGNYHLNLGISLYFGGKYRDAINNFDDAISLSPSDPIAWYFRGLSFYALGDLGRAQHDALLGMHFEHKLSHYRKKSITRSLMRIQGENRAWLERFRLGSPNGHGLRPSDASAFATN